MYGYTLQDWITIRGGTSITSITQGEQAWMGFAPYQDLVIWLDVREFTVGGATSINMNYETAPAKDEILFTPMVTNFALALSPNPTVTKILLSSSTPLCPVGRWVRWRLSVTGTPTSSWDATFRILACANAVSAVNGS